MEEAAKEKSIEELKKELREAQKLKDEYLAGWQRERADFLNYKKEEMERLQLLLEYANEGMLSDFLPLLDNLELAEKELTKEQKENSFMQGVMQVAVQLRDFLKSRGVEPFQPEGEKFNPALHEAVGEVAGSEEGMVGEVVAKGYLLRGKLLRPAKVKVTK